MKRYLSLLMTFIILCGLSGCTPEEPQKIEDYIATKANAVYIYDGPEETYSAWNIHNDYVSDGYIQRKIKADTYYIGELLQVADGEMRVVYSQNNYSYMDDFKKYEPNYDALILKEPLEEGNTWQLDVGADGAVTAEITDMNAKITVPYGKFEAMEVTIRFAQAPDYQREYYVKGIGLVRMESVRENGDVISTDLKEIQESSNFSNELAFYYPVLDSGELGVETRNVNYETNMDVAKFFEDNLKKYEEGHTPVFSENVKINSMKRDYKTGLIQVDLSEDFITGMNAGAALESLILDSLTQTICRFYRADMMELKIDGKNYESGHISLGDGEYLEVEVQE